MDVSAPKAPRLPKTSFGPSIAIVLFALQLTLAGCVVDEYPQLPEAVELPATSPAPQLDIQDPLGDAYDHDWDAISTDPDCLIGCIEVGTEAGTVTETPAPWLDVVAARFTGQEGGQLHFELDIAELDGIFTVLDETPGVNRLALYRTCWNAGAATPERCVRTDVARIQGQVHMTALYELWADGCGGWGVCAWGIETWVEPGAPATLHWQVPKAFVLHDATEPIVNSLHARAGWYSFPKDAPVTHHAYTVAVAGQRQHFHSTGVGTPMDPDTDVTERSGGQARFDPADAAWPDTTAAIGTAPTGNAWGDGGVRDVPETDILGVQITADGQDLVVEFTMANVEQEPSRQYHIETFVSVSGEPVFEIGVRQDTGTDLYGFIGQCIGLHCDEPWQERFPIDVQPGREGTYTIRFASSYLGEHLEGRMLNNVATFAMVADWSVMTDRPGTDPMIEDHEMSIVDAHWGATPFAWGTPGDLPDGEFHEHRH